MLFKFCTGCLIRNKIRCRKVLRFIIAKLIKFLQIFRYTTIQMEVVIMIYRPMYVDKIMAYVDTPFVKILTGVCRCRKSKGRFKKLCPFGRFPGNPFTGVFSGRNLYDCQGYI